MAVGSDSQFAKLCKVLGHPEMAQDERFRTNAGRVTNLVQLDAWLDEKLAIQEKSVLLAALEREGVPSAPINNIAEVFEDPQTIHREMLFHVEHPDGMRIPQVRSPLKFKHAELRLDQGPPTIGFHTDEVLGELGLTKDQISTLREAKVI